MKVKTLDVLSLLTIENWLKDNIKDGTIKEIVSISNSSATNSGTVHHYAIIVYK